MQKLPLIIILLVITEALFAQESPHGRDMRYSCTDCHTTGGWTFSPDSAVFDHKSTGFALEGQHKYTDCHDCHNSLIFSEAKSNCVDCHPDMHNNTVGLFCSECHNSGSWIVSNVTDIHLAGRFPLVGAHRIAYCSDCHVSASDLEFQPLGIECIDCHRDDYQSTTSPNHVAAGISDDCIQCHKVESFQWGASGFNHDFFPLIRGHALIECKTCHISGNFGPLDPDCYSCHKQDFEAATNPSHQNPGFTTNCADCHTIDPNWRPADFTIHDAYYFPVFSGRHRGEWNKCSDCHTRPENYSFFDCTVCHAHNRSEMDSKHREVGGYSYNSVSCLACHPTGNAEDD